MPAVAVLVYVALGMPGQPDLPLAQRPVERLADSRPAQAQAEAAVPAAPTRPLSEEGEHYAALIRQLESTLQARPDDVRGLKLLAPGYARLGRHGEAWRTYRHMIDLLGDQATAEHYGAMAEAMVLAAGGYVSPEAEQAVSNALARDPDLPIARYYAGLLAAQTGRVAEAIMIWERLRDEAPSGAEYRAFLDSMLAEARSLQASGGSAAALPGPTAEEVEAASQMSPEERQAMIEGMVARLEARLTTDGGPVEDWLRLMTAYQRLGQSAEATRAARLGMAAFEGTSEAAFLREQALVMGLIDE